MLNFKEKLCRHKARKIVKRTQDLVNPSVKKLRDSIEYDLQQGKSYADVIKFYARNVNANEIDNILKSLESKNAERALAEKLFGVSFEKQSKSTRNR